MVWKKIVDDKLKYFEENVFVALMKQLESFWIKSDELEIKITIQRPSWIHFNKIRSFRLNIYLFLQTRFEKLRA